VYAFQSCSDTSLNLKPAVPGGEGAMVGVCPERASRQYIALMFAGEYNALMKAQRENRGIDSCTAL